MNYSKSAKIGFVLSLLVVIPAFFVVTASYIDPSGNTWLGIIAYGFGMFASIIEIPVGGLFQRFGSPIIIPLLSAIFLIVGYRQSSKKLLPILGIIFVVIGVGLWLVLQHIPPEAFTYPVQP